ncbi:hypothetical protein E2C01_054983 [Portunus trituberculatus]|uniref:Uncharacterized protein n=1 Tax=Portunus trituberculatus TaxID=210409 RepID=A0A5B7GTH5_PORTR|nr:hypothetical protein [Portunus trituberculatus]
MEGRPRVKLGSARYGEIDREAGLYSGVRAWPGLLALSQLCATLAPPPPRKPVHTQLLHSTVRPLEPCAAPGKAQHTPYTTQYRSAAGGSCQCVASHR